MPPPDRQHEEPTQPAHRPEPGQPLRTHQARAGRQRPEATSALTPSPAPLMSVADPGEPAGGEASGSGRSGRRQHRRPADSRPGASTEALVYLSGRVPRALRDELHIRAIGEGRPVVDLLRDAIRGYLDRPAPTAEGR